MQSSAGANRLHKLDLSCAFSLPSERYTLYIRQAPLMTDIFKSSRKASAVQQEQLCIAAPIFWRPSIAPAFVLWSRALQYVHCNVHHALLEQCV